MVDEPLFHVLFRFPATAVIAVLNRLLRMVDRPALPEFFAYRLHYLPGGGGGITIPEWRLLQPASPDCCLRPGTRRICQPK